MAPHMITVGQLREALADYPDEAGLYFGYGDLSFYRIQQHAAADRTLIQIEFKEIYDTQKKADLVD